MRAFFTSLLAHYIAVAILIAAIYFLKPPFWSLVYGTTYIPVTPPVDPSSTEGTFMQFVGLLSWVPAGIAVVHWSVVPSPRNALPLLVYMSLLVLLGFVSDQVPTMSLARATWYWLSGPIGLYIGVFSYLHFSSVAAPAASDSRRSEA